VSSHTNGQWVADAAQPFQGEVASGDILVDRMQLLLNGDALTADVPLSGAFQFSLALQPGDNFIEFIPQGQLVERGRVPVSHNVTARFKLVADSPPAAGQLRFDVFIEPYRRSATSAATSRFCPIPAPRARAGLATTFKAA
jgi:hypothetical protein